MGPIRRSLAVLVDSNNSWFYNGLPSVLLLTYRSRGRPPGGAGAVVSSLDLHAYTQQELTTGCAHTLFAHGVRAPGKCLLRGIAGTGRYLFF